MNYPRVNLLKKNELRYQGAVSSRVLLISAIASPIILIALISGLKLLQYSRVQSKLKSSRTTWSQLEPRYKEYLEESKDIGKGKTLVQLFEGWSQSRLSMLDLLADIQLSVPGNIQFSRLSVRSKATASIYEKPEDMQLAYSLSIEGNSHGDLGEQYVFDLVKDLLAQERIAAYFDTLEPAYMRMKGGSGSESLREFKLESRTVGGKK